MSTTKKTCTQTQNYRHLDTCQRRELFGCRHVDTNSKSLSEGNFLVVDMKTHRVIDTNSIFTYETKSLIVSMLTQTENLPEKRTFLLSSCGHKLKICQRRIFLGLQTCNKPKICQRREFCGCRHVIVQTQTKETFLIVVMMTQTHNLTKMRAFRHKLKIQQKRELFGGRHANTYHTS